MYLRVVRPLGYLFASALLLASAPPFGFQIFTVGPSSDCPYHSIQDAVNAGAATTGVDYVWISNDSASGSRFNYSGQHIHVNDPAGVIIEGGLVSCSNPTLPITKTPRSAAKVTTVARCSTSTAPATFFSATF